MLKLLDIKPEKPYKLRVRFEDNTEKCCNISDFLEKGAFQELKDENLFNQVKNTGISAEWPNELDLSSDTLYAIGQ